MSFYRTYRPQRLADLDLSRVRDRLQRLVASESLPHALLFSGPKGTGKTSSARILAKIITCEKLDLLAISTKQKGHAHLSAIEPCNICGTCVSVTNGSNLDVIEIDAASNRGIDEIRSLRERIKLSPVSAKAKVYIIDEVHMLTTEAFNALLKTIEEPPSHAFFILATTEIQKVPDTIISRCVHVEFYKASTEEIEHALERVLQGEHIHIDADALHTVALYADGAFRDAVKLLEEASFASGKHITVEVVQSLFGVAAGAVTEFFSLLKRGTPGDCFKHVEEISKNGSDLSLFLKDSYHFIHQDLLKHYFIGPDKPMFTVPEIFLLQKLINEACLYMKTSSVPALPVEILALQWFQRTSDQIETPDQLVKATATTSVFNPPEKLAKPDDLLMRLTEQIKAKNQSIAALLRSCKQLTMEKNTGIITTRYAFHYEKLNEKATRDLINNVVSNLLGKQVVIQVQLVEEH